ncbi:hypothetical protein [Ralstonia pseudosolanacearum]|uniref:hypothetical protein n=1 Tax=Ralstonia pseudosolanacearum TaxID=1310165 RepID=UPI003CF4BBB7
MSLRNTLNRLTRVVIEEAERNPEFEAALNDALGNSPLDKRKQPKDRPVAEPPGGDAKRGKNRRPPAALDPVQVVRDGESVLRAALEKLSLDQLRDIVAEYGMDPSRLVMKWVDSARVVDRIVELSTARARKGDAFRKPADDSQAPDSVATGGPEASSGNTPSNNSSGGEPPLKP